MNVRGVARIFSRVKDASLSHWPFALLAAVTLAILLAYLGTDYLWGDEADTAVLAANILKCGLPQAWDGVTFTDADRGARVNDNLVMVSHPWMQYYVTALSFLFFGQNTFTARLPFALAGWITILLVYSLVWRITANRWAAFGAAALMGLSVQFLLYSRQCRNYSLNMLITCWLMWIFFQMKSVRQCLLFAVAGIFSFHTYPLGIVPVGVLGFLTLIYRPFAAQRRWLWSAMPIIIIFTLPWLALAKRGYAEATSVVGSLGQFFARFAQYLVECASVTPLIGTLLLLLSCLALWRWRLAFENADASIETSSLLEKDEEALLLVVFATIAFYGLAVAFTQSSSALWQLGIRYATPVIPLMAMTAGILIAKASRGKLAIWLPLLLIFAFTKLALLTPWMSWNPTGAMRVGRYLVEAHIPTNFIDHFLGGGQVTFLQDLGRKNLGSVGQASEFLRQHANPGDVLIANADWDPVYFHTRLPEGLRILPDYPVYQAARRKGLPEYVFSVDRVRWLVWRPYWEGIDGYFWSEVAGAIVSRGGQLEQMAEIEETIQENRDNIHFRRFSGGKYLFRWFESLPAGAIFRVTWPEDRRFRNRVH